MHGFLSQVREPPITGGCGTVFKIDTRGKETILHRFSSYVGGTSPAFPLILDPVGNMYSVAGGGDLYNGIVFMLDHHLREKVLYNFSYNFGFPAAGLVQDAKGNSFGITNEGGGGYHEGTVFKLNRSVQYTILHAFSGYSDGGFPRGTLVLDEHGNLFGAARDGGNHDCGQYGCGVVYKITP
jgi:hypothetical protein